MIDSFADIASSTHIWAAAPSILSTAAELPTPLLLFSGLPPYRLNWRFLPSESAYQVHHWLRYNHTVAIVTGAATAVDLSPPPPPLPPTLRIRRALPCSQSPFVSLAVDVLMPLSKSLSSSSSASILEGRIPRKSPRCPAVSINISWKSVSRGKKELIHPSTKNRCRKSNKLASPSDHINKQWNPMKKINRRANDIKS